MTSKRTQQMMELGVWCLGHPNQAAALVNVAGRLEMKWVPNEPNLRGLDSVYFDELAPAAHQERTPKENRMDTPLTDAAVVRRPFLADNRDAAVHGAVIDRLVELGYLPAPAPLISRDFNEALLRALTATPPAEGKGGRYEEVRRDVLKTLLDDNDRMRGQIAVVDEVRIEPGVEACDVCEMGDHRAWRSKIGRPVTVICDSCLKGEQLQA